MAHYKFQIKDKGNDHVLTPEYIGDASVDWVEHLFGVHEPDVEWFKVEEV